LTVLTELLTALLEHLVVFQDLTVIEVKTAAHRCLICLAWESQRLCSHTVAVAEKLNYIEEFLCWYRKLKVTGNYAAVAMLKQSKTVRKNQMARNTKVQLLRNLTLMPS